jgi:RNA polymerase sigma-70 factor (ECF subfamily)
MRERNDILQHALNTLVGADAEVLLLKYGERWSYRQIAERLGISEKAVDCRLARARNRLRQELLAAGLRDSSPG